MIPLITIGTMSWVYAAVILLIILLLLLVAPYLGIYGDRDLEIDSEDTDRSSTGSE